MNPAAAMLNALLYGGFWEAAGAAGLPAGAAPNARDAPGETPRRPCCGNCSGRAGGRHGMISSIGAAALLNRAVFAAFHTMTA